MNRSSARRIEAKPLLAVPIYRQPLDGLHVVARDEPEAGYDATVTELRLTSKTVKAHLEPILRAMAVRAAEAYRLNEKSMELDPQDESRLDAAAKRLRTQHLQTKVALERYLGQRHLNCQRCNRRVHWVNSVGLEPGYWAHAEPAPNGHEPVLS
jgi:hypothetical protein